MNKSKSKRSSNIWKIGFFILFTLNGLFFLFIVAFLYLPLPKTEIDMKTEQQIPVESSDFVVRTTKQNLNNLVNAYLDKLLANSKFKYSINLDKDVHLIGELPVFSTTLPLNIHFEPIIQANGDIILKQNSISVGQLELPNQQIMRYVTQYLDMPDWVIVNPSEEEIYVKLTDMQIRSNFTVLAEQIDLDANVIAFKINIPYHTLGIDS